MICGADYSRCVLCFPWVTPVADPNELWFAFAMHLEDGNEADQALNTEEAKISDGTNLMSARLTLLTAFCASCISTRSTRRGTVCNVNTMDGIPRACDGRQRRSALTKDRCVCSRFVLRRNGCAGIRESLFVRDGPSQHLPDAVVDDATLIDRFSKSVPSSRHTRTTSVSKHPWIHHCLCLSFPGPSLRYRDRRPRW